MKESLLAPTLRDTRMNVLEEIQSVLFFSECAMSVRQIRNVLQFRHGWTIGTKTVGKFVGELVQMGKVRYVGVITVDGGFRVDGYELSKEERDVRRRGCRPDAMPADGPVSR